MVSICFWQSWLLRGLDFCLCHVDYFFGKRFSNDLKRSRLLGSRNRTENYKLLPTTEVSCLVALKDILGQRRSERSTQSVEIWLMHSQRDARHNFSEFRSWFINQFYGQIIFLEHWTSAIGFGKRNNPFSGLSFPPLHMRHATHPTLQWSRGASFSNLETPQNGCLLGITKGVWYLQ